MRRLLAIAGILLAADTARADLAPPVLLGKHVPAVYRIETQEPHPDYIVVITRSGWRLDTATQKWSAFRETEFADLTPETPIVLRPTAPAGSTEEYRKRSQEGVRVFLVPRPYAGLFHAAMHPGDTPGVTWREFDYRESVPVWWGADEITVTYHVQQAASGDRLELVRVSGNPLRQCYIAAGFVTVAVGGFGFWFIRRMLREWPTAPAK